MTDNNLTDISIVLDRSGSMVKVHGDTIEGYNTFIEKQKEASGEAVVSLHQFDHEYVTTYSGKNIKDVQKLDYTTYTPRGNTALLDAVGRTIMATGARLASTPEEKRPGKVLIVVITDGEENSSREFKYDKIKEMIKHQEDNYKWTFVFLGANIDVAKTAMSLGFAATNATQYTSDSKGTRDAFDKMARGVLRYRSAEVKGDTSTKNFSKLMEDEVPTDSKKH